MHRLQMTIVRGICCAILLLPTVSAIRARDGGKATSDDVRYAWGVKVPMRDGVILNCDCLPTTRAEGKHSPLVFTFTPLYRGFLYRPREVFLRCTDIVYVLVDVRGRGNSGGEFEPFVNEGRDGYECDRVVRQAILLQRKSGDVGGSYAGFDQMAVLKEFSGPSSDDCSGSGGVSGSGFSLSIQHFRSV